MNITRLLDDLGNTAEEIRDTLLKGGYRGTIGSCRKCPISRYLLKTTGEQHLVYLSYTGDEEHEQIHPHSKELRDFIGRFDKAEFPELIER